MVHGLQRLMVSCIPPPPGPQFRQTDRQKYFIWALFTVLYISDVPKRFRTINLCTYQCYPRGRGAGGGFMIASNLPVEWLLTENSCPKGIKYSKCMAVLTKQ